MQGEIDLKRFKKLKRISKGGFGFVYQIQEKKTGELYAAKIIDCDDDEDKCNEMVNREVSILMYTKHPTIIKFIGYSKLDFQEENNVTIIMELAKNGSLREVLKRIQQSDGPKNYTNTTRQIILVGVARGMKYLHDRNIIHRDIKPENILLDENLQPHITDFGLSKFYEVGHSHSQTKFGGTLVYEAPEILKKIKYDQKVDVYSFSILMFEVLTDSVPYPEIENGEMSDLDFMNKVANQGYRPKFEVPVKDSLRLLIEQCWSENPDDRPMFDEIFNKLANKTGEEEKENCLLDDVDIDELNMYVEDVNEITDSTEKLLSKISVLEENINQLKSENEKLKEEIKKQPHANESLEEDNRQLKSENEKLKEEIKKLSDANKTLEEEKKQFISKKKKLKSKGKKQSDIIKSLEENIDQLKSENEKLKEENKKQLDTNKKIKEKKHQKSKSEQKGVKNETNEREALSNKTKVKQNAKAKIIVGGYDRYNQLSEKPTSRNMDGVLCISPPLYSSLDSSSLLSYSVYSWHSVLVTSNGSLLAIGDNSLGRISSSLTIAEIYQFTNFSIKDQNGQQLTPISAACCETGTLYMFSKSSRSKRQLVYCDEHINEGTPVFLNIGDIQPVSLFGSYYYVAAISDKGEVIFINYNEVEKSPNSPIEAVSLPDGEKASNVACLDGLIVVLSSNNRVFSSPIESNTVLKFSIVPELSDQEIVYLSGTNEHCLAVNKEGHVFGRGSNEYGQLGLGEETKSVSSFTEISSLVGYQIRAAYAGRFHTLFESREGKVLACGSNYCGQLLLSSGPCYQIVYSPKETTITHGATFCIAGDDLSVVFIDGDPPNTPNMPLQHHK